MLHTDEPKKENIKLYTPVKFDKPLNYDYQRSLIHNEVLCKRASNNFFFNFPINAV